MRKSLCNLLRCPECKKGELRGEESAGLLIETGHLQCGTCLKMFPVRAGIPVFLRDEMLCASSSESYSTLDDPTRQKILQREWHDRAHIEDDDGYKNATYADRSLFAFLLFYQLREVESVLRKTTFSRIANICCGHGFELEFLSLLAKEVLLIDISFKSLQRAVTRAQQLGFRADALCCDAENLPLQSDTFPLVLTHHSLHHLANPMIGMEEMLRVSSSHVAVFEPAKGLARSAVRSLGLKARVEEAGNLVFEFDRNEVQQLCCKSGARLRSFGKCLVTGPTAEPRFFCRLDRYGITPVLCSTIRAANRLVGSLIGTKCSILIDKFRQEAEVRNAEAESIALFPVA